MQIKTLRIGELQPLRSRTPHSLRKKNHGLSVHFEFDFTCWLSLNSGRLESHIEEDTLHRVNRTLSSLVKQVLLCILQFLKYLSSVCHHVALSIFVNNKADGYFFSYVIKRDSWRNCCIFFVTYINIGVFNISWCLIIGQINLFFFFGLTTLLHQTRLLHVTVCDAFCKASLICSQLLV